MTRTFRRLTAALILAVGLAVAACTPTIPTTSPTPTDPGPTDPMASDCTQTIEVRLAADLMPCKVVPAAPDAEGIVALGDSITWQLLMSGRAERPFYGMLGWQAPHMMPYVRTVPQARRVILLGTNDASPNQADGGWTAGDEASFRALLDEPAAGTVIVLPWLTGAASLAHREQINEARAWLAGEAGRRGIPFVDWKPYAVQTGVLAPDGIHLDYVPGGSMANDVTPTAAAARNAVIAEAVAAL